MSTDVLESYHLHLHASEIQPSHLSSFPRDNARVQSTETGLDGCLSLGQLTCRMSISDTQPLLRGSRRVRRDSITDNAFDRIALRSSITQDRYIHPARKQVRRFLASKFGHYSVLALVSLDVSCIFADFLISLYVCEHSCGNGKHVSKGLLAAQKGLVIVSLVFSCLFMVELLASVWAFGPK